MMLAIQRPIRCPGVAACIRVTATIGGAAIERPMDYNLIPLSTTRDITNTLHSNNQATEPLSAIYPRYFIRQLTDKIVTILKKHIPTASASL